MMKRRSDRNSDSQVEFFLGTNEEAWDRHALLVRWQQIPGHAGGADPDYIQAAQWVAEAVVSGVIGNAVYDAAKTVIRKLLTRRRRNLLTCRLCSAEPELSEEDVITLARYVLAYRHLDGWSGWTTLPPFSVERSEDAWIITFREESSRRSDFHVEWTERRLGVGTQQVDETIWYAFNETIIFQVSIPVMYLHAESGFHGAAPTVRRDGREYRTVRTGLANIRCRYRKSKHYLPLDSQLLDGQSQRREAILNRWAEICPDNNVEENNGLPSGVGDWHGVSAYLHDYKFPRPQYIW